MIRLSARPAASSLALAVAAALLAHAVPLAAQQTFSLPPATPAPTPAPAGPADERAGVAIPPRAVRTATPTPTPTPTQTPVIQPLPSPSASRSPVALPTSRTAPAAPVSPPASQPGATAAPEAPAASPSAAFDPLAIPSVLPETAPAAPASPVADVPADAPFALPAWWPFVAGALGGLVLVGGAAALWLRRKPKAPRLATAPAGSTDSSVPADLPRLDLTLDITSATRSVMMFTLGYRLNIANRSDRAVNDARVAVQLVCARASAGIAPSAGAAQSSADIARIGPQQARSITGQVQLPLSAIKMLWQGETPLFVPLVHVSLEGEGQRAMAKSFVIGTPSASGRVHPIALDVPPGTVAGLVAQAVAIPAVSAPA